MALHFSSACSSVYSYRRIQQKIRAVASEDVATVKAGEEKVNLGASNLKVTKLGIGAWSWGDTSYWNNFDWDGVKNIILIKIECQFLAAYRFISVYECMFNF